MTPQQEIEVIDILKEIVAALYREMGRDWCAENIERLNKLLKQIKATRPDVG